MRRCLLLVAAVAAQLATGCNCCGPYLPRLQSGWGCGTGCGGPLIHRPIVDPPIFNRPLIERPILNRPILNPLATGPAYPAAVGVPLSYAAPPAVLPGGAIPADGYAYPDAAPSPGYVPVGPPGPGCTNCGSGAVSSGYPGTPIGYHGAPVTGLPGAGVPIGEPQGIPIGDQQGMQIGEPQGIPIGSAPGVPIGVYPGANGAPAPIPLTMQSAMPGGVPRDSELLKMPTIMPPGPRTESKRPAELARRDPSEK